MLFKEEPTLTTKPGETKPATLDSLSSKPKGERILVCHEQPKQKLNAGKKLDSKPEDKEQKKPQDKSQEHKRAEPQSPKPDSSKPDSSKKPDSKPDSKLDSKPDSSKPDSEEDKEEMVLVCHEQEMVMGHKTEQNKPAHDMKPMEGSAKGLENKTGDDRKPAAGAKPQDKVPTKTAQ
jgi:hypothetical protein